MCGSRVLTQVQQGYNWIDDPTISNASQRSAVSFQTAVRSLTPGMSNVDFCESIQMMLQTVQDIASDQKPDKEKIKRTRNFFCQMLRTEVNVFDELLTVPAGRTGQWELTTHYSLI